jgi:hypothetical protein
MEPLTRAASRTMPVARIAVTSVHYASGRDPVRKLEVASVDLLATT